MKGGKLEVEQGVPKDASGDGSDALEAAYMPGGEARDDSPLPDVQGDPDALSSCRDGLHGPARNYYPGGSEFPSCYRAGSHALVCGSDRDGHCRYPSCYWAGYLARVYGSDRDGHCCCPSCYLVGYLAMVYDSARDVVLTPDVSYCL